MAAPPAQDHKTGLHFGALSSYSRPEINRKGDTPSSHSGQSGHDDQET